MNTLESWSITSPYNKTDICAKFTITEVQYPFVMSGVASIGYKHTFSMWIKSDSDVTITLLGSTIQVSTTWQKCEITFIAESENVILSFETEGTYYIYQSQLELGTLATDWTPSPDDVNDTIADAKTDMNTIVNEATERVAISESLIQQLSNCISMLIVDENGESLMTQTENGWTFSMKEMNESVSNLSNNLASLQTQSGSTQATVATLQQALNDHGATLEYVNITTYEDEPCIELGESDSDFKLLITNTRIMFMNGSNIPTYINTNGLVTQNIEVEGEIVQGGYVMMRMADDGWGLLWKGVSS